LKAALEQLCELNQQLLRLPAPEAPPRRRKA
jgi:hypothetical protein